MKLVDTRMIGLVASTWLVAALINLLVSFQQIPSSVHDFVIMEPFSAVLPGPESNNQVRLIDLSLLITI